MSQHLIAPQTRAAAFDTVAQADKAIRRLLAAGFTKDQLAVICPAKFKDHFLPNAPQTEAPSLDAAATLATGGAMGAMLGGLALAATVITGGAAGVMTVAAFIGGGAFAGGFSNLIVSKGYEQEADDSYRRAIERGQIVVGVEVPDVDQVNHLAQAQRIFEETGATALK
jgi:hypothetical protein